MPQDFSGQNLRGRDFKGQNLTGANFSGADIRGANFTNAILKGANFSYAQAGLQRHWVIDAALVISSLVLSALSGSINTAVVVNLLIFIILVKVASRYNWVITLTAYLVLFISGFIALILTIAISLIIIGFISISNVIAGIVPIIFGFLGLLHLSLIGSKSGIISTSILKVQAGIIPLLLALAEESLKTVIINTGGTSFRNADLTDANFTFSTLKYTNFIGANLTHTCWFQVKKIDYSRFGKTYLVKAKIRKLLITKKGKNLNFDLEDLRGINLQGSYLQDASFIGTDLSAANLQDADLSRAKLVQTQLDGTDFTGACLTGAFIEDWNITKSTNFQGVRCEYVYMRLPTKENPDPYRKPDNINEIFQDGDFGDFIKPIFDTLDLYHNQNVDPRAVAISFKRLAENHPDEEIRIAAVEVKGEDKLLLRAKTSPTADKSELSQEYFATYNNLLKELSESKIRIEEQDNRIRSLENMITTALERPSFYAQTYYNQGDTMSQSPKKASQNTFNAPVSGFVDADTVTAQQIGGDIHNYAPEQRQNLAEAAKEIQQLLEQLAQSYPTTTNAEKMMVVAKAVETIEQNPTLKARVIGALKAGGVEAFKELVDNPLVNIFVAALDGWQQPD
ncbi:MAG TPA: pentapeptide repeat-containing protein [Nostocaceae cyanobacterium]|nr:pentapeptide repeat-containing protein [Nostocaceae cyanobacterium]